MHPPLGCPTLEELIAFGNGTLPVEVRQVLAVHFEQCAGCRERLTSFRALYEIVAPRSSPSGGTSAPPEPEPTESDVPRNHDDPDATLHTQHPPPPTDSTASEQDQTRAPAPLHHEAALEMHTPLQLREYRLLAKVGEGGMGTVYRALHTHLDKIVALKVLPPEATSNPAAVARFQREVRAVGKLDHANIVRATDAGEIHGTHFLVMEFFAGIDLGRLARQHGPFTVADACACISQAAAGLAHAHAHGLIHRDVKPSNLLLTTDGQVKVLDLGLALLQGTQPAAGDQTDSGVMLGSFDYIAPEQGEDPHTVDHRADLYSLGCTLYHLLAGQPPFVGGRFVTPFQKVKAHALAPVPQLHEKRPAVPEALAAIVARLLAKEPMNRFGSAVEVIAALQPFTAGANLASLVTTALSQAPALETGVRPKVPISTQPYPLPGAAEPLPASRPTQPAHRHRWALLASLFVILAGLAIIPALLLYLHYRDSHLEAVGIDDPGPVNAGPQEVVGLPVTDGPPGELRVFRGHTSQVESVAMTRDGRFVVSGGLDNTLRIWDAATGKELRRCEGIREFIRAVAVTPDGRFVLGGGGGELRDGRWLNGHDFDVRLWDLATGKEVKRLVGHTRPVVALAVAQDGRHALTGSFDGTLRWWDLETATEVRCIQTERAYSIHTVALAPDGKTALSAGLDPHLYLWDLETGRQLKSLQGHAGLVLGVAFSPDGKRAVSGGKDRTLRLWDIAEGKEIRTFAEHPTMILGVAFAPDGRRVLSVSGALPLANGQGYSAAGFDNLARLWNADTGALLYRCEGHTSGVAAGVFTPDGHHALTGSTDRTVRLWRLPDQATNLEEMPAPPSVLIDADLPTYQEWLARMQATGYQPIFVDACSLEGKPHFAAVAVRSSGVWQANVGLDRDAFQKAHEDLATRGYRMLSSAGYEEQGMRRTSIWIHEMKPPSWYAWSAVPAGDLVPKLNEMRDRGYRPSQLKGFRIQGVTYFATIFEPVDGTSYLTRIGCSLPELANVLEDGRKQGYRPVSLSAFVERERTACAVVLLQDNPALAWSVADTLTPAQLRQEIDRRAALGYRPQILSGRVEAGEIRYLAAFVRDQLSGPLLPRTGRTVPELEAFDRAMLQVMSEHDLHAASLAVMKDGRLVLARGYGYRDRGQRQPVQPDTPFRLASVVKPITAAAIRQLIRAGQLQLDTPVFPLLGVEPPPGQQADPRLKTITVQQLLEHQGGWDSTTAGDPMFRSLDIAAALGKPSPPSADDMVRYMAGQPLQFDPGSKKVYSNFGYCVLGRVIEKVTGQKYVDHVREELLKPLGITSVALARSLPADRDPREPYYEDRERVPNVLQPDSKDLVPLPDGGICLEAMDSHGGLIGSAPDLLRFFKAYRQNGEPVAGGEPPESVGGSLPGTFTLLLRRPDGVCIAAFFNQRYGHPVQSLTALRQLLEKAADGVKQWPAEEVK